VTYAWPDLELTLTLQGGVSVALVVPGETCSGDGNACDCGGDGDGVFVRCSVVVTAVRPCFPKNAAVVALGNHQFRGSHLFLAAIPLRLQSIN